MIPASKVFDTVPAGLGPNDFTFTGQDLAQYSQWGMEEFVVVDLISVAEEKSVLLIEAKRSSLGEALKQCLLSLKDLGDNNGGGEVYGFTTTGKSWRMIRYDGKTFSQTHEIRLCVCV